jgi:hypothetical protein
MMFGNTICKGLTLNKANMHELLQNEWQYMAIVYSTAKVEAQITLWPIRNTQKYNIKGTHGKVSLIVFSNTICKRPTLNRGANMSELLH